MTTQGTVHIPVYKRGVQQTFQKFSLAGIHVRLRRVCLLSVAWVLRTGDLIVPVDQLDILTLVGKYFVTITLPVVQVYQGK